jgi:hypothetical protein
MVGAQDYIGILCANYWSVLVPVSSAEQFHSNMRWGHPLAHRIPINPPRIGAQDTYQDSGNELSIYMALIAGYLCIRQ